MDIKSGSFVSIKKFHGIGVDLRTQSPFFPKEHRVRRCFER